MFVRQKQIVMTSISKCPKCSGTGKVNYSIDNGVCYKCEGAGIIGGTDEERDQHLKKLEVKRELTNAVKSVSKYIGKKLGTQTEQIYQLAISLKGIHFSTQLKVSNNFANLFESEYIDNYSYVNDCLNHSPYMLNCRKILAGKKATISKISEGFINVSIN